MVNSATKQFTFSPIGLRPQGLNDKIKSGQLTCYKSGQFYLLPTGDRSAVSKKPSLIVGKLYLSVSHLDGTMNISLVDPLTYNLGMEKILVGYARCSTYKQDLAAQHAALIELGVEPDRIIPTTVLQGLTGTGSGIGRSSQW